VRELGLISRIDWHGYTLNMNQPQRRSLETLLPLQRVFFESLARHQKIDLLFVSFYLFLLQSFSLQEFILKILRTLYRRPLVWIRFFLLLWSLWLLLGVFFSRYFSVFLVRQLFSQPPWALFTRRTRAKKLSILLTF